MKHTFKYTLTALTLLLSTVAFAQSALDDWHDEGKGVATHKTVSNQNSDGSFTLTLENCARGATAVTQRSIPSDIVLILDVSSSMGAVRGTETRILNETPISYNDVMKGLSPLYPNNANYLRAKNNAQTSSDPASAGTTITPGSRYQLFGLKRGEGNNARYYLYWIHTSYGIYFLDENGNDVGPATRIDRKGSSYNIDNVNIPEGAAETDDPDDKFVTIPQTTSSTCRFCTGSSRIRDLEEAVCAFIDVIDNNDKNNADGTPRTGGRLGNRISIITFAGPKYGYYNDDSDWCSARLNSSLTSLSDNSVQSLKSEVSKFILDSGTRPKSGFSNPTNGANNQFATSGRTGTVGHDYTRTIVFFTDGAPEPYSSSSDWDPTDPDGDWDPTVVSANTSKNTYKASVFSVLMDSSASNDSKTFMNYVSSNYPNATSIRQEPAPEGGDSGFFMDASSSSSNLTTIFKSIAHAAGGSSSTVGATSQVRDVVSSSFKLPIDTSTMTEEQIQAWADANVKVFTSDITSDGNSWQTPVAFANPGVTVAGSQVTVTGFDFTKDDEYDADGFTVTPGNWVGPRYSASAPTTAYYAGKKLIVQFNIFAIDDATGGNTTQTNASGSGVYVLGDNGYESINDYEVPIVNVPINLVIKKTGLRHGQSATFEIETCIMLTDNEGKIVYNEYGKPVPFVVDEDDPRYDKNDNNTPGWHNWSKVVLTNKGADGAEVTKTLRSLDAKYIYRIVEDKWGWSYDVYGAKIDDDYPNTANQLTNPFRFHNQEKADAVKHAEAVVINHFATSSTAGDSKVEGSYKSSKVESFESENPITNGTGE